MRKIDFEELENIKGMGVGTACYFSSMVAVAGFMMGNFALVDVGGHVFYGCVRYL